MRLWICGLALMLALGALVPNSGPAAAAEVTKRCIVCGMNVSKYPHTRYVVENKDGKKFTTCGVQCGLTLHIRLGEKWKSAAATDLLTNRPFDATTGFYVYKSSVITDMAPGFISFRRKEHAEKFVKGFGGRALNYRQALDIWKKQMK